MKIDAVVFDMAGTTINEDNIVYKTLLKVVLKNGVQTDLPTVLQIGAGKEKYQAIKDIIDYAGFACSNALINQMFQSFLIELENAYDTFEISAMPDAAFVFNSLRKAGVKVVLNTGYNRKTAESLLTKVGWEVGRDIDLLVTASDVKKNRPYPDMILLAKAQLGIPESGKLIKIGDSCIDIEEGIQAKCTFNIGITTGAQTEEQLKSATPNYIIHDLKSLLDCVDFS